MFSPAVTSSCPAWPVETAVRLRGARGGSRDERHELLVEGGDLAIELGDAARERAQRELGGLGGLMQSVEVRSQPGAQRRLAARGLARGQVLAEVVGDGDDHLGELVERSGARLDRTVARQAELTDRFDDPVGELRNDRRVARERLAGGHLGVGPSRP
jgi:hypothetical protein